MLAVVQSALWAHANAVAQAAADHGAEIASSFGSTEAEGELAAQNFLAEAGAVRDAEVDAVFVSANRVEVRVTGTYPTVFGSLTVESTAVQVREVLTTP